MENNRNFFITIALSVLILVLWQVFYMNPRIEAQREAAQAEVERVQAAEQQLGAQSDLPTTPGAGDVPGTASPAVPGSAAVAGGATTRESAIAASDRIVIETPRVG